MCAASYAPWGAPASRRVNVGQRVSRVLAGMVLLGVVGCDVGATVVTMWQCKNPDDSKKDRDGNPDPCHFKDCSACAARGPEVDRLVCQAICDNACANHNGTCVPEGDDNWGGPLLFWSGPSTAIPPECPGGPSTVEKSYVADPVFLDQCTCTSAAPAGSCVLPSMLTASTAICYDPSGSSISFDAPMSWDGSCTSMNAIASSAGADSLTIAPLTMTEGVCPQTSFVPEPPPVVWKTITRTCQLPLIPYGRCASGAICAEQTWSEDDFQLCVVMNGDESCPPNYTKPQRVFYKPEKLQDKRACAPCTLGSKPIGGTCSAQVSVYHDGACSTEPHLSRTVTSDKSLCDDLTPGAALGSKSAGPPVHTPGDCSGTSEVIGIMDLEDDSTKVKYCCQDRQPAQ